MTTDRQTRDLISHPKRGNCLAVYYNGPSFLELEDGTHIELQQRPIEGVSLDGAYRIIKDPDHGEVKAKVLKAGEQHFRRFHQILGAGWFVHGEGFHVRFEADSGHCFSFEWETAIVGPPARMQVYLRRRNAKNLPDKLDDAEAQWRTYLAKSGEIHAFCVREIKPNETLPEVTKPTTKARSKQTVIPGF